MIGKTEYHGCTIEVLDNLCLLVRFDEDEQQTYITADAAREAIDDRLRAAEKARAHRLQLGAITNRGERFNITGIHLGTQQVLGLPKDSGASAFYPDVPSVATALAEMALLQQRVAVLTDWLQPFTIRPSRGYGHPAPDELEQNMIRLEREYAEKKAAAEMAEPPAAVS